VLGFKKKGNLDMRAKNYLKKIKSSLFFQYSVTIVILLSSVLIGVETYDISQKYLNILFTLDSIITIFFVTEILIRFLAEEKKIDFFKDGWNIFDLMIVISSLIPSGVGSSVVVLRLLRLARLLRIISFLPELRFIIESLVESIKQSASILILTFILLYIYGVAGVIVFGDIIGGRFETLGASLLTLFQIMTLSSWETIMLPITEIHPWSWIYFVSFIFMSSLIILNLFIAVLVDIVADRRRNETIKT
jgi:voltage-gated sodium channel